MTNKLAEGLSYRVICNNGAMRERIHSSVFGKEFWRRSEYNDVSVDIMVDSLANYCLQLDITVYYLIDGVISMYCERKLFSPSGYHLFTDDKYGEEDIYEYITAFMFSLIPSYILDF